MHLYMQVKNVGESLSNGIGQALLSTVIHSAMSKEGEAILALILHPKGVRIIYRHVRWWKEEVHNYYGKYYGSLVPRPSHFRSTQVYMVAKCGRLRLLAIQLW